MILRQDKENTMNYTQDSIAKSKDVKYAKLLRNLKKHLDTPPSRVRKIKYGILETMFEHGWTWAGEYNFVCEPKETKDVVRELEHDGFRVVLQKIYGGLQGVKIYW